jgi:hypothetical protein
MKWFGDKVKTRQPLLRLLLLHQLDYLALCGHRVNRPESYRLFTAWRGLFGFANNILALAYMTKSRFSFRLEVFLLISRIFNGNYDFALDIIGFNA